MTCNAVSLKSICRQNFRDNDGKKEQIQFSIQLNRAKQNLIEQGAVCVGFASALVEE